MARDAYFRGAKPIDQRITGAAIERIATWMDLADSKTNAVLYPELPAEHDSETLAIAWMWAALLIADITEIPTELLRQLHNGIMIGLQDV